MSAGVGSARGEAFFPSADLIQNQREVRQWQEWMRSVAAYLEGVQEAVKEVRVEFLDIHIEVRESRGEFPPDTLRRIKRFEKRLDNYARDLKEARPPSKLLKYHLFIIEYFRMLRDSQGNLLEKEFVSYIDAIRQADTMFLRAADELLKVLQQQGAPPEVLRQYQSKQGDSHE